MKAVIFAFLFCLSFSFPASAQEGGQSDAEQLGSVAGAAQACKAYKEVFTYEEIASRLISSMAANESVEKAMMTEYVKAKAQSFRLQRLQNRIPCSQLINAFMKMPIFKFELYSDGTLKTPEGKFLYPRGQKGLQPDAYRTYPSASAPRAAAQKSAPPVQKPISAFKTPAGGFSTPPKATRTFR